MPSFLLFVKSNMEPLSITGIVFGIVTTEVTPPDKAASLKVQAVGAPALGRDQGARRGQGAEEIEILCQPREHEL